MWKKQNKVVCKESSTFLREAIIKKTVKFLNVAEMLDPPPPPLIFGHLIVIFNNFCNGNNSI